MKGNSIAEWYAIWLLENQSRFNEKNPIPEHLLADPAFSHLLTKKQNILEALIFWEFVREIRPEISWSVTAKESFVVFLNDTLTKTTNRFVQAVTVMELLPVPVWRKLLWRENIDFVSYESFLRRITDKQLNAMTDNLLDVRAGKVARVERKSILNNVLFNPKMETVPLADGDFAMRYLSRAAWAYNLLGIDFGFALYSKGPDDDTPLTNQKFSRFLSIKEHINDFVVNQEDGKYWWLYKTARSNYSWFPNRSVELKTHVCPGFWKTLLLHLMFWVVSPLCFGTALTSWVSSGTFWSSWGIATLATALTPLWLFIAFLRLTLPGVARFFGKIFSYKKFWEIVGIVVFCLVILCALFGVLAIIWIKWQMITHGIMRYYDFCGNVLHLGVFIATIAPFIIIVNLFRALDSIFGDSTWKENFLDKPMWFKVLSILIGFQIVDTLISPLVVKLLQDIVYFAIEETLIFIEIAGSLSFIAYLGYILLQTDFIAREEEYARHSAKIRSGILYWIGGQIILLVMNGGVDFNDLDHPFMAGFVLFSILFAGTFWLMTEKINDETMPLREEAASRVQFFEPRLNWYNDKGISVNGKLSKRFKSLLLKNEWLMSLPNDVFQQKLDVLLKSFEVLSLSRYSRTALEILLPILDEKLFHRIIILNRHPFHPSSSDYVPWLKLVISGVSGKRAMAIIEENHRKKVIAERNVDKVLTSIANFFKYCYRYTLKPIFSFFVWCGRSVVTLRDLWKLFNERCPYISKQEHLG